MWLEVLQLNKAHVACQDPKLHRGQSRSRLDHRPGLLPCEKSPHLLVCGTKNLEGQAAGNKVSRTSLRARSHGHAFLSAMATGLALEPCGFKQARTATASADELDTPSGLAVAPNPSLFVSSSRFLVLMSAPSHQQHSSSRSRSSSNNRMDPRPHAGVTRPTTPPPKHCDIDMYTVRGWVTTTRRRHRRPHHPSPSTKILNPARPLGQPRPTIPSPTHATPGAVFGRPPPRQPPTLGRVPGIVGGFLWTPCRRIPKPIPRETRATPSTLFATPARQAPVPKATSARPPAPLGRVAIVAGLLSTPYPRVPAAAPRQNVATPSALFATPARRVPVPKATSPQPPVTFGRVARVGGFLSTPCRRMPKATPRPTHAAPSAVFATPARRAPASALFSLDEERGTRHGCPSRGSSQAQEQGQGAGNRRRRHEFGDVERTLVGREGENLGRGRG